MVGTLTKNDKISGGAGVDTITLNQAALTTEFAGVTGFETVKFNANESSTAAVTYDVSKLSAGVTTVAIDVNDNAGATADDSITNLGSQAVVIRNSAADATNDQTVVNITGAVDTGTDSVSVTLIETVEASNAQDIDELDVANYETVNLTSSKETTTTSDIINDLDTLTSSSAKSVYLYGDQEFAIGGITGGAMTTFDASGLAAKLSATFSSTDKITATAAQKATTFNFGTTLDNNDVVIGGAGKDTVTATLTGKNAVTGALNISGVETLTLTTSGSNTLDFAGNTGLTTASVRANTQTIKNYDLSTSLVATDAATIDLLLMLLALPIH